MSRLGGGEHTYPVRLNQKDSGGRGWVVGEEGEEGGGEGRMGKGQKRQDEEREEARSDSGSESGYKKEKQFQVIG